MSEKRFCFVPLNYHGEYRFVRDNNLLGEKSMSNQEVVDTLNKFQELSVNDLKQIEQLKKENELLKSQLYCDDEEGICNICKHHYLIKDDEAELGYYNSRCKKGHYECARVSLKHCEDFEKKLIE